MPLYVLSPGRCTGHTHDHVQGPAPAPGTVAPGHAVVRAAALVPVLPGTDLQKTGLQEMIARQRTGQDPGKKVPRTGLAPGTMDAPVHPRTALKVVPAPDLAQGAGKNPASGKGMMLHLCSPKKWTEQVLPIFKHLLLFFFSNCLVHIVTCSLCLKSVFL